MHSKILRGKVNQSRGRKLKEMSYYYLKLSKYCAKNETEKRALRISDDRKCQSQETLIYGPFSIP